MSTPYYIIGIALAFTSCGGSDEKKVSLEQTRAAIEVRDAWREELKPFEIVASGSIAGVVAIVGAISVYIAMNNEEQDVKKKIMMVVGACIFLVAAAQALPLFFGL